MAIQPKYFWGTEFAPSIVTDVEEPQTTQVNNSPDQISPSLDIQAPTDNPIPSTSSYVHTPPNTNDQNVSPESIRPYPKATREQKLNGKGRRQKGSVDRHTRKKRNRKKI